MCRTASGSWQEADDLAGLSGLRRGPDTLTWAEIDISGQSLDALRGVATEFGLDPLALEDAVNARQRPKLEVYSRHRFLVLFQLDEVDEQLEPRQLGCFLGDGYVLVLHHGADRLVEELRGRLDKARGEPLGVDRLVHLLIDAAVDDYEAIASGVGAEVEDLEGEALAVARAHERSDDDFEGEMPSQAQLYTLKQNTSMLRRFAIPAGRALERLLDGELADDADEDVRPLLRDVHDHSVRLEAQVRNIEELAQAVLDLTRSLQADILNEINKKLTGWAAIIAVPAIIVGLYGINYQLLPRTSVGAWGFVFVLGLMLACGGALFAFFKRKDWI
jgi:magnesium transporter